MPASSGSTGINQDSWNAIEYISFRRFPLTAQNKSLESTVSSAHNSGHFDVGVLALFLLAIRYSCFLSGRMSLYHDRALIYATLTTPSIAAY